MLSIEKIKVCAENKDILDGIDLKLKQGFLHFLIGENGSGKSTLAQVISGNPRYRIVKGSMSFHGKNLLKLSPDKRAKLGIFVSFQYPREIEGVEMIDFLYTIENKKFHLSKRHSLSRSNIITFESELKKIAARIRFSESLLKRYLNHNFSGGEKKKSEILQMLVLQPKMIILDEIDSGLDAKALQLITDVIKEYRKLNKDSSFLIITHQDRLIRYLKPDRVHLLRDGRIAQTAGGSELFRVLTS